VADDRIHNQESESQETSPSTRGSLMSVATFEGIVEQGQIKLKDGVRLPDNTKVYIVVPDFKAAQSVHRFSPRLVYPEQAKDFRMEMIEGIFDANR
jgi:hypothetical protein